MFTNLDPLSMARQKLTPDERKQALRHLRDGGEVGAVASELGAPRTTIAKAKEREVRSRDAATTEGKPVSARLSPTEIEALERLKARHGLTSNSDAIRALVRASSGLLEFDPDTAARLEAVQAELRKIGVNVNQVAFAANKGRVDLLKEQWEAINALRQALPNVRVWLQAVVDEQRRRGVRLFRKFVEAERG